MYHSKSNTVKVDSKCVCPDGDFPSVLSVAIRDALNSKFTRDNCPVKTRFCCLVSDWRDVVAASPDERVWPRNKLYF
jgi:hypothetical protein